MSRRKNHDRVQSVKSDIGEIKDGVSETVNGVRDRLPTNHRTAAVTNAVTNAVTSAVAEGTKQVVDRAQELTREAAAEAQHVAKAGVPRRVRKAKGGVPVTLGLVVLLGLLMVGWWRRTRRA